MLNDNMLRINWTMPNFVNVCIDGYENGEFSGRFFHKYDREPVAFEHFMGMVKQMEDLYDTIDYPQATFRKRSFLKEEKQRLEKKTDLPVVWDNDELGGQKGAMATFYVLVKSRTNATWQGEVIWVEKGLCKKFRSAMELMILMDNALK